MVRAPFGKHILNISVILNYTFQKLLRIFFKLGILEIPYFLVFPNLPYFLKLI